MTNCEKDSLAKQTNLMATQPSLDIVNSSVSSTTNHCHEGAPAELKEKTHLHYS